MNGGTWLDGAWLPRGSEVTLLRPGYIGRLGIFKGKTRSGKLAVDVVGGITGTIKLRVLVHEIRRAQAQETRPR